MCGRYRLKRIDLLEMGLRSQPLFPGFEEFSEHPHFNVAPAYRMPIVRLGDEGRELAFAQWGLIPSWAKEAPKIKPINARAETVATGGMFRQAFSRRRCIVPADGFYEWRKLDARTKQPMFIHFPRDRPFGFAGLWERWRGANDEVPLETFTIITTTPNELMAGIHNRMPVILRPEDYTRWLDGSSSVENLKPLLAPYPEGELEAYPVSSYVNSPKNTGPGTGTVRHNSIR